METQAIHAAALAKGIVPHALDQVTAKTLAHFAGRKPAPAEVEGYLRGLPVWDKIGMTLAEFSAMPPAWRLGQAEAFQPPVDRRATPRVWTAEELQAMEGKSVHDRLTMGHAGPPQA